MATQGTSMVRADHRIIRELISNSGGGFEYIPSEFDRIASDFSSAGGSWYGIFSSGSTDDMKLLKETIKKAKDSGALTKKHKW